MIIAISSNTSFSVKHIQGNYFKLFVFLGNVRNQVENKECDTHALYTSMPIKFAIAHMLRWISTTVN